MRHISRLALALLAVAALAACGGRGPEQTIRSYEESVLNWDASSVPSKQKSVLQLLAEGYQPEDGAAAFTSSGFVAAVTAQKLSSEGKVLTVDLKVIDQAHMAAVALVRFKTQPLGTEGWRSDEFVLNLEHSQWRIASIRIQVLPAVDQPAKWQLPRVH